MEQVDDLDLAREEIKQLRMLLRSVVETLEMAAHVHAAVVFDTVEDTKVQARAVDTMNMAIAVAREKL